MAEDLQTAIVQSAGQAATVRVGLVTATNPLAISLNGTPLNMDAVGVLGGGFTVGGPALLLGQSVQGAETSGSTWCALGAPLPASHLAQRSLIYNNEAIASAAFPFNAVGAIPAGLSLSIPLAAGVYDIQAIAFLDAELGVNSTVIGLANLNYNGVARTGQIIISPRTAGVRFTVGQSWTFTITLAVDTTITLDINVARVNGADGQLVGASTHSKLGVQIFR
jgi:hypothetical protein